MKQSGRTRGASFGDFSDRPSFWLEQIAERIRRKQRNLAQALRTQQAHERPERAQVQIKAQVQTD
jgi:hypothetical protein